MANLYEWAVASVRAGEDAPYHWETIAIAEMVIRIDEPDEAKPRYTCRHFDTTAGLCTIYDHRPRMCADYPSYGRGSSCTICGWNPPANVESLVQIERSSPRPQAGGGWRVAARWLAKRRSRA